VVLAFFFPHRIYTERESPFYAGILTWPPRIKEIGFSYIENISILEINPLNKETKCSNIEGLNLFISISINLVILRRNFSQHIWNFIACV
jgi:hypothetical protein